MGTNLQECLTYLSDIDFNGPTIRAAREELAELTQRANRLGMTSADVEREADEHGRSDAASRFRARVVASKSTAEAIRALKRTP